MITYEQLAGGDPLLATDCDPNGAPEGYFAVPAAPYDHDVCALCALPRPGGLPCHFYHRCTARNRRDSGSVFFVRR